MGLVNPIQRRREEKKRELSLRIESRASKDSRLFLGRAMETERGERLGQGQESESGPNPPPPALPTRQLVVSFPRSMGMEGTAGSFPESVSFYVSISRGQPWSQGCRQPPIHKPLFGLPDHVSSPDWRASPPPFRAAGPASACPEQRPQNSPGLAHLGRKHLPRKLRP